MTLTLFEVNSSFEKKFNYKYFIFIFKFSEILQLHYAFKVNFS